MSNEKMTNEIRKPEIESAVHDSRSTVLGSQFTYCNSLTEFSRFKTREVHIGHVPMGGDNPIRIQTMTSTNTMDTRATVEQTIRCIEAGADYVRITAPGVREAENLENIKSSLNRQGYFVPLIADIHYNPKAAEIAAQIVEKVRINPGNYIDTKKFETIEYTNEQYSAEIERISDRINPLLAICKQYNTAIRIGVNHGSLSDRTMSRYGDTPEGMAEAAMEFIRICEAEQFNQLVISLKSSNTRVMVQAYRILAAKMLSENMNYPLHLGVTEAGDGEDGRIKSSAGIGALLADGIGDTVRVSLTEEPELEIPVAKEIVHYFSSRKESSPIEPIRNNLKNPFEYQKRESNSVKNIGGKNLPIVITDFNDEKDFNKYAIEPEYYFVSELGYFDELLSDKKFIQNLKDWFKFNKEKANVYPLYTVAEYLFYGEKSDTLNFVIASAEEIQPLFLEALKTSFKVVLILETFNSNGFAEQRSVFLKFIENGITTPVVINRNYTEDDPATFQIKSAADIGPLFIDGFGDGLWIRNAGTVTSQNIVSASYGILQASRIRSTKTEYISCPSCGRTLFDLQTTTARIKERTMHLKHLKIGIMGCIVNGPGEMADADYGYVGAGPGKITLYKGKEVIKRGVDANNAVDELIALIKSNGDWIEPI